MTKPSPYLWTAPAFIVGLMACVLLHGCETSPHNTQQQNALVRVGQAFDLYTFTTREVNAAIKNGQIDDLPTVETIGRADAASFAALQQAKQEALRGNGFGVEESLRVFEAAMQPLLVERLKLNPQRGDMTILGLGFMIARLAMMVVQMKREGKESLTDEEFQQRLEAKEDMAEDAHNELQATVAAFRARKKKSK